MNKVEPIGPKKIQKQTPKKRLSAYEKKKKRSERKSGLIKDLYIIHGWTYTVEPWRETLETMRDDGFKVQMLRVPGLTEPSKKEFTIDDYAKWADENIPDGAIALGHSNGGRILLNLCAKKPEKLKYLILLDAAGIYEPSTRKKVSESRETTQEGSASR